MKSFHGRSSAAALPRTAVTKQEWLGAKKAQRAFCAPGA